VSRHEEINREICLNGAKLSAEGKTMADLRITGVTNNQLELQAPDGTRHYLEITDDLLKALRPKPVALPTSLSPREIQAEIRTGTTVAELVARTGVNEELISKFAAPIISELAHIVTLARNIRLSLTGERFTDQTQIEFGTVMDERLAANGATDIRWVAKKSLDGDWLVSAQYQHNSTASKATWSFDPKNLLLVPENQSAMQLSNAQPLTGTEAPQPQKIAQPSFITQQHVEPIELDPQPQTAGLTIVPELIEVETETIQIETRTEVLSTIETETRTTFHVVEDNSPQIEVGPLFEEEETSYEEEIPKEQLSEEANSQIEEPTAEPTPHPKTQSTSRWAEVLFGTKDEED
jgi:hypothetical protein